MAETDAINANTFVDFAQRMKNGETPTIGEKKTLYARGSGDCSDVVLLEDNKVFIAYADVTSDYYINCAICTIEDDQVVVKTSGVTLASGSNVNTWPDGIVACALTPNLVVVAYSYNESSEYAYAIACKIDGNNITVGSAKSMSSTQYTGVGMSIDRIDDTKALLIYSGASAIYGAVLSVSGTTITKGTQKTIQSVSNCARSAVKRMDTNKLIVCYDVSDGYYSYNTYAIAATISSTTVTVGSPVDLGLGRLYDVTAIDASKACVLYGSLKASILTISGTTITIANTQNDFSLCPDSTATSPLALRIVYFDDKKLLYMCYLQSIKVNDATIRNYYILMCSFNDNNVITKAYEGLVLSDSEVAGSRNANMIMLDNDRVLLTLGYTGSEYLTKFVAYNGTIEDVVRISTGKIDGITKTECTADAPGEVWVLN